MSAAVIPVIDREHARAAVLSLPVPVTGAVREEGGRIIDTRGRPLRDLRISVTDACNFRCRYCMPKEKFPSRHQFLAHTELLTFEEIERLVRIFVKLGIEKVRLTGGEPLLRKNVDVLVHKLKGIRTREGQPLDVAMTTNATLLARMAGKLKAAGLSVKVNTVVKRGMNEGEVLPLCEHFRNTGIVLRFIEYMDAGTANGWRMDEVVPSSELVQKISAKWPLKPVDACYRGEVASRWAYADGAGEVGFISSVTQAFCRDCTRARLSVEGGLFLCLFADRGYDIRTMLRGGATDEEILEAVARIWTNRDNHYSEIRTEATAGLRRVEMQYIGG